MNAVLAPRRERTTAEWQAADAAHFLHPFTDFQSLAQKGARIITRADNIYLWDSDGHKILDAMSGLWCVNVGYGQEALVEASRRSSMRRRGSCRSCRSTTPSSRPRRRRRSSSPNCCRR
jgi:adenosylmethionine-8-amino-7-oxononanoate aminotransferase